MKYKYGVEYQCNGEKPDLPDDVIVRISWKDGNHTVGHTKGMDVTWIGATAFRIVDERYKPLEKDNNWFERGELPPVGAECEVQGKANVGYRSFCKVKIIHHGVTKTVLESLDGLANTHKGDCAVFETSQLEFRPIRTEREKAIEAAIPVIERAKFCGLDVLAAELYDAGLLRLPEGK